ncbi:MAG: glycosyltransferase [Candidatus Latescibacterota bacterium]
MTDRNIGKKHKILILDNSLNMGGLEKKLFEFVSRIDTDRFAVAICCLKEGGYFREPFKELGVPFYENIQSSRYDPRAYNRLSRIIREEKADIIYSFAHSNTVLLSHIAMMNRLVRAWIVSLHATGSPSGGRLIGPVTKRMLSRVSRFIAVAHEHKKYLVEVEGLPADNIEVIHNGVNVRKYHPGPAKSALKKELGIEPGDRVITTIASLNPRKRHDLLLQAAADVLERHPRARFLLVGGGPERQRLERMAEDLAIGERVIFAGIRDDVDDILRASELFVLSSMRGTETFPNVLLEAMACGLPVVSTDVGSVRELVAADESATVVPPENAGKLAAAIDTLLADEEKARAFSVAGRRIVEERFTIEQMCEKREKLFDALLADS